MHTDGRISTVGRDQGFEQELTERTEEDVTVTANAAQISTPNPLSPQRCVVTLTATGPTSPETPPRDGSNNSTEVVIDVLDKNP